MLRTRTLNFKDGELDIADIETIINPESAIIAKGNSKQGGDYYFTKFDELWKLSTAKDSTFIHIELIDGENPNLISSIIQRFVNEPEPTLPVLASNVNEDDGTGEIFLIETTSEACPYCDEVVEIDPELKVQKCPHCGKYIVTCSMCIPTDPNMMKDAGLPLANCSNCILNKQAEYLNKVYNK